MKILYNPLEYAITVLNMVADGRTTDYDGVPINIQAALAVSELTHGLGEEDKPRYNHAVTIAFEAWSDDPKGPSDEEYRQGLINRIRELDADKAWGQVNVDSPFDTYEVEYA